MKTFRDWELAVRDTQRKLNDLRSYLNDAGAQRLKVFSTLVDLAGFCANARELVAWIDSPEELTPEEIADLENAQAALPLRKLRWIAAQEGRVK